MDRQSGGCGLVRLADCQGLDCRTDKGKESPDGMQVLSLSLSGFENIKSKMSMQQFDASKKDLVLRCKV